MSVNALGNGIAETAVDFSWWNGCDCVDFCKGDVARTFQFCKKLQPISPVSFEGDSFLGEVSLDWKNDGDWFFDARTM